GTSRGQCLRLLPVEITHAGWQSIDCLLEPFGKRASKGAKQLRGDVDFYLRINLQEMVQPARLIPVAVRNHDEVQVFQVNARGCYIGGKDFGVIACIKQNFLARIFDQNRETPILLEIFRIPKSIVEDGGPAVGTSRTQAAKAQQQAAKQAQAIRR